jgi:hypothetical protein
LSGCCRATAMMLTRAFMIYIHLSLVSRTGYMHKSSRNLMQPYYSIVSPTFN